jgi:predicted peptidase
MRTIRLSGCFLSTILLIVMTALLSSCSTQPIHSTTGRFVEREITSGGVLYRYQVFVPAQSAAGNNPPIILFLHGSGERGRDGQKQTQAGLGPYLRTRAADFPAIVVFPQSPEGKSWDGATADLAMAALDAAMREFGGDASRTYLTGMSRGGYGTYELALRHPGRFAALVPVCGGITSPRTEQPLRVAAVAGSEDPFRAAAARLKDAPIWIFHGGKDDLVPPEQSRRMFAELKAAGGDVRYTEFPDANHNSWDATYRDDAMWAWLFAQRKR